MQMFLVYWNQKFFFNLIGFQKKINSYWFLYSTSKYGNCYTFNSMENVANDSFVPREASLTVRDNGNNT